MNKRSNISSVFDLLSKGQFICSNAVDIDIRDLYIYIEENIEELKLKFSELDYHLISGNNYYYFSNNRDTNQSVEKKIEKAIRWIDILSFFISFRHDFCRGARFSPHDILPLLNTNLNLKEQLEDLQKGDFSDKNYQKMLDALIKEVHKDGFIDLEDEMNQKWIVLDSWDYMEQLILAVSISDDIDEEILENKQVG